MWKVIFIIFLLTEILTARDIITTDNAISSGIGGAFTAYNDVNEVLYYNPANFINVKKASISLNYNSFFNNLNIEKKIAEEQGYYSVNIYTINASYIGRFNKIIGIGGYYSYYYYSGLNKIEVINLSLCSSLKEILNINKRISIGAGIKYIINTYETTIYNEAFLQEYSSRSSGLAGDIGIGIGLNENLFAGFSIWNIVYSDIGIISEDRLVTHYRTGMKFILPYTLFWNSKLKILADFDYFNKDYNIFLGTELQLNAPEVFIRAGINFNYVAFGLGYSYKNISVNYAFNYIITEIEGNIINNKIGLSFNF